MIRAHATIALTLVLALFASPATAEVPSGDYVLRGAKECKGDCYEGSLKIKKEKDGRFEVSRSVKVGDKKETLTGTGTASGDTLTVTLTSKQGIAGKIFGATHKPKVTAQAVYTLEDDGSLAGSITIGAETSDEVATLETDDFSKKDWFAVVDREKAFRTQAKEESLPAFLSLLVRRDVPADVDRAYTKKAGSFGGGRVLMALDYTRGFGGQPDFSEALRGGPKFFVGSQILGKLTHFRHIDGAAIFQGDKGYHHVFQDHQLTVPHTNQVGHMLCAVASGVRLAYYEKHGVKRRAFELALRTGDGAFGLKGVEPTVVDWNRAGIIGHEMAGDGAGEGVVPQMNAYGRLVANGDPERIRESWDNAVKAVLAGDHATAWRLIHHIARVGEMPKTRAEMEANAKNPSPRFTRPGDPRVGNSLQDMALSVYGYALGYRGAKSGYATPEAARADYEANFHEQGRFAAAIEAAAGLPR